MNFIKNNWQKLVFKLFFLSFIFITPFSALFADGETTVCPSGTICNPLKNTTDITGFIKTLLKGLLKISIPVVALAVIYCGFLFVEARGKPEKLSKAKDALLYTLIGAAILLGSWAIAELITNTVKTL